MYICPLTQRTCSDGCAWRVEEECAAVFLAREMYTLVDVLARSLPLGAGDPSPAARSLTLPLGAGDPSPNRSPAAPVGADDGN